MENLNKKRITIFVILVTLTLVGVGVAIFNSLGSGNSNPQDNSETPVSQTDDFNVTQEEVEALEKGYINIKNFNEVSPNSDPLVKQQAKSALYPFATNLKPGKESYDGEIRQGTFIRTQVENNHFKEKMIVDIPELKQSWGLITFWSNTEESNHSDSHVYIVCLDKELLKFGEFDCNTIHGKYEDY